MTSDPRHATGVPGLDEMLGGGLLPGALTVVVGATGIGKTQLGLQFANAGIVQEQRRGVIFDVSARGDSQRHAEYAQRMFGWSLRPANGRQQPDLDQFFQAGQPRGDYLHLFDYVGRRVTRRDLEDDQWRNWRAELNAKLQSAIGYLYGNFIDGVRRLVVDGVEPVDRPHDSIQLHVFEYVYHQILKKDPQWVARDFLREKYRQYADAAEKNAYDADRVGCLLLYTSHESMLEDLISRPLDEGDVLSNANSVIYMGKIRSDDRLLRAIYIAKHRGSACSDRIAPYEIDDQGLRIS